MILHKRISKILLQIFFLSAGYISTAQTRFALFAGAQAVTASYQVRDIKQTTSFKPGFLLGAGYKIEFEKKLFFSPAVYYSYKGYKVTLNQAAYPPDLEAIKNDISVHTLELAPLLEYNLSLAPQHFFIKFGPSIDIQLSGKENTSLINGTTVSRNLKYGYTEYGRYAASAIIQFGYKLKNDFFIQAQYSHGLTDLNNADAGPSIKYRVFGLSVGSFL